jgi:hypothetical protein
MTIIKNLIKGSQTCSLSLSKRLQKTKPIKNQVTKLPYFLRRGGLFVNSLTNKTGWLSLYFPLNNSRTILTTLLLCLLITSCTKTSTNPSSSYPTYSDSGKNVFACKYNGLPFIACNSEKGSTLNTRVVLTTDEFNLGMSNDCGKSYLSLDVRIHNPAALGDTMFFKPENNDDITFEDQLNKIVSLKINKKFWCILYKYDRINHIASGKFGGTLIDYDTKKDIIISEGFFDYQNALVN